MIINNNNNNNNDNKKKRKEVYQKRSCSETQLLHISRTCTRKYIHYIREKEGNYDNNSNTNNITTIIQRMIQFVCVSVSYGREKESCMSM